MIKVYGWIGIRYAIQNHHKQSREICAAKSKAEVYRIAGSKGLFNLSETHNSIEIEVAMSKPGTIFWSPLDSRDFRE